MKQFLILLTLFFIGEQFTAQAANITYPDSWGKAGFTLERSNPLSVEINFSITRFSLDDRMINGEAMKILQLPGNFLPNDEGMPNLPGMSRFVAIPQGADVELKIISSRTEIFSNINMAPAPPIPFDTEEWIPEYKKNPTVYSKDALYPENPVQISGLRRIRGVDVVILGITPFQYNPLKKELIVYRDLKVQVSFSGGNGHFGEDRLRSRSWDPILEDMLINNKVLPEMDYTYSKKGDIDAVQDVEYLIIVPEDPVFQAWADSLKLFRNQQGISAGVVTTNEIGGNTFEAIETYIDNAYNNWIPAPSAVLLLADYGSSGSTITSSPEKTHPYSGTYITDNGFADVDGDKLPEIVFSRITAQNAEQLEIMVGKILDYERNPPTNPDFYNHPITAMGWQTSRWFQICSESINGFWELKLGKAPVRENVLYSGGPADGWSTAENTETVVSYFGPDGLGYIPATPDHLTDWGGNATRINNDINSGAFMIQHRDHGSETGWGHPAYYIGDLSGLDNDGLIFVFSINCLTGRFNWSSECFAEAFHRYAKRALGIIAASQVSYSFVNDTYTWGAYDNMWPEFMPDETTTFETRWILPAFGNAAGKYFLEQSDWPYNDDKKPLTYDLFHHHGGCYSTVYSEIPQHLTVTHNDVLQSGATSFAVTADEGALIGLTVNGEIIGVGEGTGGLVEITITSQEPGDTMLVTITKQNYYRYSKNVPVVSSSGPYITVGAYSVDDYSTGNGNGQADFDESILLNVSAKNLGSEQAYGVSAVLSTADSYLTITDSAHIYGDIDVNQTVAGEGAFALDIVNNAPDQHSASCQVTFKDSNEEEWVSNISITINAPSFKIGDLSIDDSGGGNNNGIFDPGETVDITIETMNTGHADAPSSIGVLKSLTSGVTVNSGSYDFGTFTADDTADAIFSVSADESIPLATSAYLEYTVTSGAYSAIDTFEVIVGQTPEYSMSNQTVLVTNAIFYDSGGPDGDYSQAERLTMTFKAEDGKSDIKVHFTSFKVADGDELYIHDGAGTSSPQIPGSPFSGTSLPPDYFSTNSDYALTFFFKSNVQINDDGWRAEISSQIVSGTDRKYSDRITNFELHPNYPNPFNPTTTIKYDIPREARVLLKIYNIRGQEVRTLVDSKVSTGSHRVVWNGTNNHGEPVTSGIYIYKMKAGNYSTVKKMIFIK
jgi:hypothetical protein